MAEPNQSQSFDDAYKGFSESYEALQKEPDNQDLQTKFNEAREKLPFVYKTEKDSWTKEKEGLVPKILPPEKYELTIPEGSLLDPSEVERISAYAKEKGLSNEAAQELLNGKHEAVKAFDETQVKAVNEIREKWVSDGEKDPEIGGVNYKKNIELASRVVKRFGSEKLFQALEETSFGQHPEWIRVFARIGAVMSEDQLVHSKTQEAGNKKSSAEILFPMPAETK